ncbi:hypothetical protein cyc_09030 [Cyclospora cayetanensis]|uniref:Uncharacterized protein n=1 Tax=Cyclospora cayetanensis TaxID=88456 RepID=A0A1D3CS76_9EIME|nr:hypothetical protein cyc_09030 [Cyclospora cayetanensis]
MTALGMRKYSEARRPVGDVSCFVTPKRRKTGALKGYAYWKEKPFPRCPPFFISGIVECVDASIQRKKPSQQRQQQKTREKELQTGGCLCASNTSQGVEAGETTPFPLGIPPRAFFPSQSHTSRHPSRGVVTAAFQPSSLKALQPRSSSLATAALQPCNSILATASLRQHLCNSILATASLQQQPCDSSLLQQQHPCNSSLATAAPLQQHPSNSILATAAFCNSSALSTAAFCSSILATTASLQQQHPCNNSILATAASLQPREGE